MMIAEVSDAHLLLEKPVARLDDILVVQMEKLSFVLDWCQKNKAILVFAGDLSNRPRSWYLLPEIMDLFKKYESVEKYAVYGQHDTYMRSEKTNASTSLGILEKAGLIRVLDSHPLFIESEVYLYGASYGQDIPEGNPATMNILVLHAPIADQALWVGQNYWDASKFLHDHSSFAYIICGDIHQKFCKEDNGRFIVNSGPLIRKEATAYNFIHKPGFFVFDTKDKKEPVFIPVPCQAAELVLSRAHIDYKEEATDMLDEFIGSVKSIEIDDDVSIVENIWALVKKNNIRQEIIDVLSGVMAR